MVIFFRDFSLDSGEATGSVMVANMYRGARSIGGRLAVTDRAVVFEPNWVDFVTFARGRRVGIDQIVHAEVLAPVKSVSPHKSRTRVRINVSDADPMILAVRDHEELVSLLG